MNSFRMLSPAERLRALPPLPAVDEAERSAALDRWTWWRERYFQDDPKSHGLWIKTWVEDHEQPEALVERTGPVRFTDSDVPDWFNWLTQVQLWSTRAKPRRPAGPVAAVMHPFIECSIDRLRRSLLTIDGIEPAEITVIVRAARKWLRRRLHDIAAPSASVAVASARLTGVLDAETAPDRLEQFRDRAAVWPRRVDLVERTPVLDRLLAQVSLNTLLAIEEAVRHSVQDREALSAFVGSPLGRLAQVEFGLGDSHRAGRTVARFCWSSGAKLVYKPRSMSADLAFNAFLGWIGSHLDDAPAALPTLDLADHGWASFAEAGNCDSELEVKRAFRRMGILLAAFDLCGGSDLHYENIIFAGVNPYIVDLETILMPIAASVDRAHEVAAQVHHGTIMRTGYLPGGIMLAGFRRDVSAGGIHRRTPSPFFTSRFDDRDGEEIAIKPKPYAISPSDNCPTLRGRRVPAAKHVPELESGIREAYDLFCSHAAELQGDASPLSPFQHIELRWVARGTGVYSQMLEKSQHPVHMRDGVDHEMAFANLAKWGPAIWGRHEIIRAELDDLWQHDVPIFTARGDSLDVQDSKGRVIPGIYKESGWAALQRRLGALDESTGSRAVSTVRCAFDSAMAVPRPHPSDVCLPGNGRPEAGRLIEEAQRLGRDLRDAAYVAEGVPFWVTPRLIGKEAAAAGVTAYDLYQGVAGIGIFFGELSRITACPRARAMADSCRRGVRIAIESSRPSLGAFNGLAGLAYAEARIGGAVGEVDLHLLRSCLEQIRGVIAEDLTLDVIGGSAGALLITAQLAERPPLADLATEVSEQLALHLLDSAHRDGEQTSWRCGPGEVAMTGFAHGSIGIASALAAAVNLTGDSAFDEVIDSALNFDRAAATSGEDPRTHGRAWCHGTVGLTLGRQLIRRWRPDLSAASLDEEISRGLTLSRFGLAGGNDSLCHGVMGNIEPYLEAGLDQRTWADHAAAQAFTTASDGRGWRCSLGQENPGLMLGLAGIGHQLLRLADPSTPSVLTLSLRA